MTEGDLILAVLLIAGFALLGTLITLGNIRQARAIREIGVVLHDWAIRHIQLTRTMAAASIRIDDPLAWLQETLNRVMTSGNGAAVRGLSVIRTGPGWILIRDETGRLFLLHHPRFDPRPLEHGSRFEVPVLPRGFCRKAQTLILSPVTVHPTFDLELAHVWRKMFPDEHPPEQVVVLAEPLRKAEGAASGFSLTTLWNRMRGGS